MDGLFYFRNARSSDPAVERWARDFPDELAAIARRWFDVMRSCGDDVTELLHDGHPTACVAGAAFAYVDVFTRHVNVGFYRGAELDDPVGLLQGNGRLMRHIKLVPGKPCDVDALTSLIKNAYSDMKRRACA